MTERRIAHMFDQSEREEAVLLSDEADGFLRDRARPRNAWEVTQVNELPIRMEAYADLFVCSTNLMVDLDPAALRRFGVKIRFAYLRPKQAWRLFRAVLIEQGCRVPAKAEWLPRLDRLERLTSVDFATQVRRQPPAAGPLTPAMLFEGLRRESAFRNGREGSGIGFTADL